MSTATILLYAALVAFGVNPSSNCQRGKELRAAYTGKLSVVVDAAYDRLKKRCSAKGITI